VTGKPIIRRPPLVILGLFSLLILVALCFLVGHFAARGSPPKFFDWELAFIFGTALGTSALAVATGALAYTTSRDVSATSEIAELTRADQAARERPVVVVQVLAWTLRPELAGGELELTLRNVGLGPALRIDFNAVYEPDPDAVPLQPFGIIPALMPGEETTVTWGTHWRESVPIPHESGFRVYGTYRDRSWANKYEITVDETDPRRRPA
jgi:hypothetical protein